MDILLIYMIKAVILPPGSLFLMAFLGLILMLKKYRIGIYILVISLCSMYLLSMPVVSRLLAATLEKYPAVQISQLQGIENEADLIKCLLPVEEPLSILPAICLKECQAIQIANGNQISVVDDPIQQGPVRMYIEQKFLGIGEVLEDASLIPKRIFNLT